MAERLVRVAMRAQLRLSGVESVARARYKEALKPFLCGGGFVPPMRCLAKPRLARLSGWRIQQLGSRPANQWGTAGINLFLISKGLIDVMSHDGQPGDQSAESEEMCRVGDDFRSGETKDRFFSGYARVSAALKISVCEKTTGYDCEPED